jgi:hypothetical protein
MILGVQTSVTVSAAEGRDNPVRRAQRARAEGKKT